MNEQNRKEALYICSLSSEDAATFLLRKYPDRCPVTIRHRSWKRKDQIRLARQFLHGQAHASARVYEDFLSFMSLELFLNVMEDGLANIEPDKLGLLSYYLIPALRRAPRDEAQREAVERFILNLQKYGPLPSSGGL